MLSLIGVYTACNVYLNRDTKRFIILIMWLHKLHVSANQWNLSNGLRRNWEGIALCSSMSADYCTTKCKDMVVSPDVIVILQSCHTNHCTARVQHTHTDPPLQKLWYWSPPLHLLSLKNVYSTTNKRETKGYGPVMLFFFLFFLPQCLQCPSEPNFCAATTQTNQANHKHDSSLYPLHWISSSSYLVLQNTWSITRLPSTGTKNMGAG